jgi:hypothetical protein
VLWLNDGTDLVWFTRTTDRLETNGAGATKGETVARLQACRTSKVGKV